MTASTAKIVLSTCTLRWSSPILFNDPFDVPRELTFGVMPKEIVEAVSRRLTVLMESPPEDTSHLIPSIRFVIDTIKNSIPSEKKAEFIEIFKNAAAAHRPTGESMDALRDLWRSWIPELRILCLADNPSHIAMWYHYADQYKGAVLELRCDEELDSAWLTAEPVTYSKEKPEVYTADGWAEILSLQQELGVRKMFHVATYSKDIDWSYENEWRIVTFKRPNDIGYYSDFKFNPLEISAIYLGPLISDSDRNSIISLSSEYPNSRLVEVKIGMSRELIFNEILAIQGMQADAAEPRG